MRRSSLVSSVSSVVAAAGLSACVNGPIDPVELIATDVKIDAEHPEMSRLPDGSIAQRYIVVLRNDLLLEGYAPGIVSELVIDNDIAVERVYQHALGGFAAALTPSQRATLAARPDVAFVVPDMPVHMIGNDEPETQAGRPTAATPPPSTWGLVDVLGASWESQLGGNGVTVSVLDTGVDTNHAGLPTFLPAHCLGDFTSEASGSCEDLQGHGTHVSGTIAALDVTTTPGGNRIRGLAPNALLRPGRVLNTAGSGSNAGIVAGIDAAALAGSDVINMSLGGAAFGSEETDVLCTAITNAANAGTLSVVAAGNEGRDAEGYSPSRCNDALAVGAYDVNGKLASFTNFGAGVGINAPGVTIASTTFDGLYGYKSGTSMASPHAAAVAALFLQDNPGTLPAAAKAAIIANSTDRGAPSAYNKRITSSAPKLDGRDY